MLWINPKHISLPVSPSYDLAHLAETWLDLAKKQELATDPLGWLDGQCVQGAGTYSPLDFTNQSKLFRLTSDDQRLLGISTSWGRVAALNLNWGRGWGLAPPFGVASHYPGHCRPRVTQGIRSIRTCRRPHFHLLYQQRSLMSTRFRKETIVT